MTKKRKTARNKKERVKTAKGRSTSSTQWLKRQLNDPYVAQAQREGYRGRAAYKLIEIDEKADILKPDMLVIDLGAAPGGWSQVAAHKGCKVIGLDLLPVDPIDGATFFQMDFMDDDAPEALIQAMGGLPADLVMSDMAPNTIGHRQTDHLRIMALVELAYEFARQVLKQDGIFLAKVRQGGAEHELLAQIKRDFKSVKHIKPPASRPESAETYLIAQGFRG